MGQKAVAVTVNPGVDIQVDDQKVKIAKNSDTVAWKATNSSQQFGIVLPPGEPAVTCDWQGNKWVCVAGPFTNTSGAVRTVKYDVTAAGTPTLDPDIEIQT